MFSTALIRRAESPKPSAPSAPPSLFLNRPKSKKTNSSRLIIPNFILDPALRKSLAKLNDCPLLPDGELCIDTLNKEYQRICDLQKTQAEYLKKQEREMIALEEYKLVLMRALHSKLQPKNHLHKTQAVEERPFKNSKFNFMVFIGLLSSGLMMNLIHGFINQSSLVSLIPGLSIPVATGLTLVVCFLNAGLWLLFEGYILKRNFNIGSNKSLSSYLDLCLEKVTLAKEINNSLAKDIHVINKIKTAAEYKAFADASNTFTQDILDNKQKFTGYKENPWIRALRYGLMGFGAVMASGTAFFAAKTLIKVVALSLIGTPLGWALMGAIVVCAVAFYFGLKPKKYFYMTNPNAEKFTAIEKELDGDFDKKIACDNILARKLKQDAKSEKLQQKRVNDKKIKNELKLLDKKLANSLRLFQPPEFKVRSHKKEKTIRKASHPQTALRFSSR